MPATYQGNTSNNTSATGWLATHAYNQGNLVRPSTGTGQVFLALNNGTSGGTEPAWSGPIFPTIGTQFIDGGVTWMMSGTEPGPWGPIVQLPVDSDPPLAYAQVVPDATLADQMAWLTSNAGLLNSTNVWTGNQEWTGSFLWQSNAGGSFEIDGVLTYGGGGDFSSVQGITNWYAAIFFAVYGQADDNATINGFESPTGLGQDRLLLEKWRISNTSFARWYSDVNPPNSVLAENGLTLSLNAQWQFPGWVQDDTGQDALFYTFGTAQFEMTYWPAGTPFSSAYVLADFVWKAGFQGLELDFLVFANNGLQVQGGDLDIEAGNNLNMVNGTFTIENGSANIQNSVAAGGNISTPSQLQGGSAVVTNETETGTLVVDTAITEVGGVTTAGNGVPLILPGAVISISIPQGSGPVNVGPAFTVTANYYKFLVQLYDNPGQIDAHNFQAYLLFSNDSVYPATLGPIQDDNGNCVWQWNDSSNNNGFFELTFFPSPNAANETVQLQISMPGGSGTTFATAQLIQMA